MEIIKAFADTFKITIYEILAILLPGTTAIEVIRRVVLGPDARPPGTLVYILVAYIAGITAQGFCAFLVDLGKPIKQRWRARRRAPAQEVAPADAKPGDDEEVIEVASALARSRLGFAVPKAALLDFCLTRIDARRTIYERFVAMRDMARGVGFSAVLLFGCALFADWPSGRHAWAAGIVSVIAVLAMWNRYWTYARITRTVALSQFLAVDGMSSKPATAASEAPAKTSSGTAGAPPDSRPSLPAVTLPEAGVMPDVSAP